MRFIYMVLLGGLLGVTACNNATTSNPGQSVPPPKPVSSKLGHDDTQKLMAIVSQYYKLKNALVAAKADRADTAATQLEVVSKDFANTFSLKDSTSGDAIKLYIDTIITQSEAVHNLKDETCEKQRIAFDYISRNIYAMLKNVDLKNAGIYREHCPMAFNERGAYWLSDDADIKNPYFGKKMLECGEVTDSL